ncbi:MAG TPA: TA system VapC family ribonuclease toxin [Gemmatimonadota bacterium]|nr:TA system VapC family ribonuclease toxin [Gemmatimonadota bacterium]
MILIDANLLVYAHVEDFAEHQAACKWLDERLSGLERVGLPWSSILAFLRLITNPRIFPRPVTIDDAWQQARMWLQAEPSWIPQPTDRHTEVLGRLFADADVRGDLIPDAHLAALAIEHGLTLCSVDGDFSRFPELQWMNPLRK